MERGGADAQWLAVNCQSQLGVPAAGQRDVDGSL